MTNVRTRLAAVLAATATTLIGCANSATASAEPPDPTDFKVDVIVTGKQCFSSASCVYTYDVKPSAPGDYAAESPSETFTVIYTVTGGDQDQVGNFTVTPVGAYSDRNVKVIGPDGATFTATVTRVIVNE